MCHTCWFGYKTPKWLAAECSSIAWRRETKIESLIIEDCGLCEPGQSRPFSRSREEAQLILNEWKNEPMPYDPWFETEECRQWMNPGERGNCYAKHVATAIKEYHEGKPAHVYPGEISAPAPDNVKNFEAALELVSDINTIEIDAIITRDGVSFTETDATGMD